MRKLIVFNMTSLDGFFEGPDQDLNWHNVDDEFNDFAIQQIESVGTILFGRVTYVGMASYWPTPAAIADDPVVADKMNNYAKIVFSSTLDQADWHNTRLVKGDAAAEVARLKAQPGEDMIIFGSSDLAASLVEAGLVDEIRIIIAPLLLGGGRTIFDAMHGRHDLKLIQTRSFASGNVLLYYRPV